MFGAKLRRCLKCEKYFESTWIGNRLCSSCKHTNQYRIAKDYCEHSHPYMKNYPISMTN